MSILTRTRLAMRVLAVSGAGVATIGLCGSPVDAAEGADPMELLHHSALAGHTLSYTGTQFVAIYGEPETATVVADVSHTAGAGSILKIHATPRTPAREVFEADSDVDPWSTLSSGFVGAPYGSTALKLLGSHYVAAIAGAATVAGRAASIVELTRESGTPAARFWLDDATALPLRREIYDEKGQLTRLSAYLDIALKPARIATALVANTTPGPLMTGQALTSTDLGGARSAGWVLPDVLGTMQLVEIRTGTSPSHVAAAADESAVMHLVYSDGLSTVSVFQQKGRLAAPEGWTPQVIAKHKVWVSAGVPTAVAWSARGRVYTIVSDAAPAQLEQVIQGLPRPRHHGGLLHRLHRGVDRVGSWFNPFG